MTAVPDDLIAVLNAKAICFVSTLMPDGSPQISQTWAGTDGVHVLVNTVDTHQKTRNVRRDQRVALGIADPAAPSRYWALRGSALSSPSRSPACTRLDQARALRRSSPRPRAQST